MPQIIMALTSSNAPVLALSSEINDNNPVHVFLARPHGNPGVSLIYSDWQDVNLDLKILFIQ